LTSPADMTLAYCDWHALFGWIAVYCKREPWFGPVYWNEPIIFWGS
jgi:hypothetical protein